MPTDSRLRRGTGLSDTDPGKAWLGQFGVDDQALATRLLESVLTVSTSDMTHQLSRLVEYVTTLSPGAVALYVEREIGTGNAFHASTSPKRRAFGYRSALPPIGPSGSEIGSEGVLANMCTNMNRLNPTLYLLEPGPDEIRNVKVRNLVFVTDLVGSGLRVRKFLDSFWRLATIRSWSSFHWIDFHIVCYSATRKGRAAAESHPSHPSVHEVLECPTIHSEFDRFTRAAVVTLCRTYSPISKSGAMGFDKTGALIAFAHSAPNNMPTIFTRGGGPRDWVPLFPNRVTLAVVKHFGRLESLETLVSTLERMGQLRLARSPVLLELDNDAARLFVLLASLGKPPRTATSIAQRTGFSPVDVVDLVKVAQMLRWIGFDLRLTDEGIRQIEHARSTKPEPSLVPPSAAEYYPKSLRRPK